MQKGQVSFEFLMVSGIALFILAGSAYFLFDYTQVSADKSGLTQVSQIGYRIVDEARNVYVFGEGSFVTIKANLPAEIHDIYIRRSNYHDALIFEIESRRGIIPVTIFSNIPLNGTSLRTTNDWNLNSSTAQVHSGRSEFRVESYGTYVEVSQTR